MAPGPVSDFAGMIPPSYSAQIIQEVAQTSAIQRLATRVPMGTSVNMVPVPKTFPTAGWTANTGGRKPYTGLSLSWETLTAEEVAAIIAIPDAIVEDSSINLWAYARPLLAEAIAVALDNACIFGVDAPPSFPAGGVAALAVNVTGGSDHLDTINQALSMVENSGLAVTGSAADMAVKGALRGMRDAAGDPLCGCDMMNTRQVDTMYGYPIVYVPFTQTAPDFVTGAWKYAFLGVRQDIRYQMSRDAVIVDSDGAVVVNAFQDNMSILKVWARYGFAVVRPVTSRCPGGATPFAKSTLAEGAVRCAPGTGGNGGNGGAEPATATVRGATPAPARPASGSRRA